MAHQLFHLPKPTAISNNLTLLPGAKVGFFITQTSTPTDTYQDFALTTPHTNPVIADAAGRLPPIYLNPDILYRVTFTDSDDVEIYPAVDPVNDRLLSQAIIGAYLYPRTAAEIAAGVTPTSYAVAELYLSRYSATATTALTEAASVASQYSHARIIVDRDVALTANTTIPINATLVFDKGAVITPAASVTLTVLGNIEAGPRQIFDLSASGSLIAGPIKGQLLVEWWGAVGNGDGVGGGTSDSTYIQRAFTYLLSYGGTLLFDTVKTYLCNAGITLLSSVASASQKPIRIDYSGCLLDFSNLTGSSIAIRYGATSLANAHSLNKVRIGNVRMIGPELDGWPWTYANRVTTTTGISLEFCQHWVFDPHEAVSFYRAMHTFWSWSNIHTDFHLRNSWIGLHLDEISTVSKWDLCNFIQCGVGVLFRGSDTIEGQTFDTCRFEGNNVHWHMDADPGAAGSDHPIRDILFDGCYYEAAIDDWFRVGMDFDETAVSATRQATNTSGDCINIQVRGGEFANNVISPATAALFCFDKDDLLNATVIAFDFSGPVSLTARCRGRPSKSSWHTLINPEHDSDPLESFVTGEFAADLTMTNSAVTLGRSSGNILSVAHVSDGVFDITFREAYTATAEYGVFGSADNRVITTANTSATVCRVTVRDFAGTAAFAATLHLFGRGRMA